MYEFKTRLPNQRIIYKTVNGLNLPMDIYLPDDDSRENSKCILFIHGGGWKAGVKDNSEWNGGMLKSQAGFFAEKGYVSITISYRSLQAYEGVALFDLLEDCFDAMKYIKANLDYVDYDKMIVFGESAGGHLSTMLAISQNDDIRPYAVVSVNPVLDTTGKWSYGIMQGQDKYSVSPLHQKPKKCAKILLTHGTNDTTVDIRDTDRFYYNIKELGHEIEFIKIEDAIHAYILFDYKSSDEYAMYYTEQIYKYITQNW